MVEISLDPQAICSRLGLCPATSKPQKKELNIPDKPPKTRYGRANLNS
jgi:hypothetical protein